MATTTKTVISTNVPQAKPYGISIIIDEDQVTKDSKRLLTELGNSIRTNVVDVGAKPKQEMSPNSPTTKQKSTLIDVNSNRCVLVSQQHQLLNDSQTNGHQNYNDNDDSSHHHQQQQQQHKQQEQVKETGYVANASTFPPTMGEIGKQEKAETAKTTNGLLVGKSPTFTTTRTAANNELVNQHTNGTTNIISAGIYKKTIIQCNIVAHTDDHNNVNDDNNDDDDESRRICGVAAYDDERNVRGQLLQCNGVRKQKLDAALDEFGEVAEVSRLTIAEDCASSAALKQTDSNTDTQHIVKIQIKPQTFEKVQILNTDNSNQQVTVVQVNELNQQQKKETQSIEAQKQKSELSLNFGKMVQKPQSNAHSISTSGNTTVTELNVSSPNYFYYTMSSGQFSPCDTLDSGTGSDLESNGNSGTTIATKPKAMRHHDVENENDNEAKSSSKMMENAAPKLEMHLKTTKLRIHNKSSNSNGNGEQQYQRAGSLTDSEESETSSLSCDSLHSTEYVRQLSASPSGKKSPKTTPPPPSSSTFLPDSLLRDIRDRKFPTNDFETKYGHKSVIETAIEKLEESVLQQKTLNEQKIAEEAAEHAKYLQACKERENQQTTDLNGKRLSLPPPGKTFIINAENGTFVDTKMNSMPRKYEADKYYNFHVNEHENFHSFGHLNSTNGDSKTNNGNANANHHDHDEASLSEYDLSSIHDDDFAGYKDIRCSSTTSTIRSSKGTVRGVKNRVRNGIATFLQMQHPHVKTFLEKDLGKVVLYTTSMGIIRDTYAKCSNVKQILRTLLVKFEERDVFMSVEYQAEIKNRMHTDIIRVPQLFVEGQHIGDAETVERLNESGELRQLLKPYKSISTTYTCQTCGGYRLLPCPSCNGSKKSVHRNHFTAEFVALKCMNCDEVGLVKCHNC